MRKKKQARLVARRPWAAAVRGFFRTRQIYVRSRNDVHYITFHPIAQVGLLSALLAGLFWTAYASVNIVFKDQLLELKQQKLFEARLDHEHQLAEMRATIEKANDRLLLNQQAYLKKLDEVKARFDAVSEEQDRVHDYFRRGWFPLKPSESKAPATEGALPSYFRQRYAADFREEADAQAPLADMDMQISGLSRQHLQLIADGQKIAEKKLANTEQLVTELGIRVEPTGDTDSDAAGGPFIPEGPQLSQDETEVASAMASLDGILRRKDGVVASIERLPLGMPMQKISRISSEYGYRTDPLRRTLALHGGIDFISDYGAEVIATSAGRVTWAGRHGPYGNLVEIQHDNGVATRYGHLKGVNVSLGQKVEAGVVIGWLGNTGRSTGPHLHYETRVNDHAIDPRKFWRTSNDLQTLKDNGNGQQ